MTIWLKRLEQGPEQENSKFENDKKLNHWKSQDILIAIKISIILILPFGLREARSKIYVIF